MKATEIPVAAAGSGSPAGTPARLAWLQARLALERTLLAWVRTAAALIGFGFTIFHFFEAQQVLARRRSSAEPAYGTHPRSHTRGDRNSRHGARARPLHL